MKDNARELIAALRGGIPSVCDFCGKETDAKDLHPEEMGEWACIECIKRWDEEEQKCTF